MDIQQAPKQDFFGKDKLTPFIGVVEDVNDPKQAARVKVRCVGWHPKEKQGENGISTDDLPWARVSAPTTHAQNSRVGSKHGLLPGCWVWGFFLDGDDAQDPMVTGSFPFTAKNASKDLHEEDPDAKTKPGTQNESIDGFTQTNINPRHPNTQVLTDQEKGAQKKKFSDTTDPGGASPSTDDSMDNECGERISANTKAKRAELKKGEQGNNNSLNYDIMMGDGNCGTIANAADDVQRIMKEQMPSEFSRFLYGDAVWNQFTGSHMNLQGIMAQISLDLCARFRQLLTQSKAEMEENINRPTKTATIKAATTRDGITTQIADEKTTVQADMFHAIFTQLMEQMCGQVMDMIKQMDSGSGGGSKNGKGSSKKNKGLQDPGSKCVAEQITENFAVMTNNFLNQAQSESEALTLSLNWASTEDTIDRSQPKIGRNRDLCEGWGDLSGDDWTEIFDQIDLEIEQALKDGDNGEDDDDQDMGSGGNDLAGILSQLGSVTSLLQFSSINKFALIGSKAHSRIGNATLDERLRQGGCRMERMYNTVLGAGAGMAGGQGGPSVGSLTGGLEQIGSLLSGGTGAGNTTGKGSTGDGQNNGLNDNTRLDRIRNVGFGGLPGDRTPVFSTNICEDGKTKKTTQNKTKNPFWAATDNFEINQNIGRLRGEKTINGKTTNKNRVLLKNQNNKTENGIWNTNTQEWERAKDANSRKEFKKGKRVVDNGKIYEYSGPKANPTLDKDDIEFKIVTEDYDEKRKPSGKLGRASTITAPSSDKDSARNFDNGTPNQIVITEPGKDYFFESQDIEDTSGLDVPDESYPSVYIPEYNGTPVPVLDANTGEIVAILTNPNSFNPNNPSPPVSIFPDINTIGIRTDDPNYDIELGGVFVGNTGFDYGKGSSTGRGTSTNSGSNTSTGSGSNTSTGSGSNTSTGSGSGISGGSGSGISGGSGSGISGGSGSNTSTGSGSGDYNGSGTNGNLNSKVDIRVIDKDTGKENGEVRATVLDGRIVEVEVINSGRGFRRLPDIIINDKTGFGVKLYPIMNVIPKPDAKPLPMPVKMIFCPGKKQLNGASE